MSKVDFNKLFDFILSEIFVKIVNKNECKVIQKIVQKNSKNFGKIFGKIEQKISIVC